MQCACAFLTFALQDNTKQIFSIWQVLHESTICREVVSEPAASHLVVQAEVHCVTRSCSGTGAAICTAVVLV
jgi:hypothetical protein